MVGGAGFWFQSRAVTRRRALADGARFIAPLLGATWLTACGSGNDSGRRAAPQAKGTAAPPTDEGPPQTGGVYRIRIVGTPPLDPYSNTTYRAQVQAGFTMSRLFMFKTGPQPQVAYDYEIVPDLAQSYEVLDGGLQYAIKLHPAARFHQKPPVNGRPVTTEDVRASFERFRSIPKNPNKTAFGTADDPLIEKVESPDERTLLLKLARPFAPVLSLLANPSYLWIFPREAGGGYQADKEQIGSGPFVLDSIQADVEVRFLRNPHWHFSPRPYIDTVVHAIIADTAQEVAQFQAERLDSAGLGFEDKAAVAQSNPKVRWLTYTPTTYTFIAPQLRGTSVWKDERLRRALSLAIDRDAWLELLYGGGNGRYLGALPASFGKWWVDPQGRDAGPGGRYYQHDPKEARALLRAAGQEGLTFRYIYSANAYGERFNKGAEATAKMLKEAGFAPQSVTQDFLREYSDPRGTFFGHYEGAFYGLATPFQEPHDYFFNMFHSKSKRNHAGVNDPELDRMIDDQARTLDAGARLKKVHDIQRYLMERLYYIALAVGDAYTGLQPWVRRYQHSATYGAGAETFAQLWLDRT